MLCNKRYTFNIEFVAELPITYGRVDANSDGRPART